MSAKAGMAAMRRRHAERTADGLHNMSAPPRSRVTVRPMLQPKRIDSRGAPAERAAGVRSVKRFALEYIWCRRQDDGLFERLAVPRLSDTVRSLLAVPLILARIADGVATDLHDALALGEQPSERLEDELLDRVAAWDVSRLRLPAVALLERHSGNICEADKGPRLDLSLKRTLFVFAHRRGNLLLRDVAPAGFDPDIGCCLEMLVPAGGDAA
jgi:hypothetical protein